VDNEEDDKEQEDKETVEKEDDATGQSGSQWGILSLMFEVSQKAMTPLREIYDFPITEFFFYASYLVEQNRKQIRDLERIRNKNR
jgi:hypothetical protein